MDDIGKVAAKKSQDFFLDNEVEEEPFFERSSTLDPVRFGHPLGLFFPERKFYINLIL